MVLQIHFVAWDDRPDGVILSLPSGCPADGTPAENDRVTDGIRVS